ncbi:hypothetical protein N1851_005175 [Merluccius polli]|uniref:Sterile alpha motif domain containing 3 n=1 Tax=Merluccius polli TaxID=89951 RepID=A0AA47N673_MERPO|nr:hypothetical protein N1851_005175 [Merluccius polli]
MKMGILEKLADKIFSLRAYPDKHQIEAVSSELVQKHPCLKEPGSGTGYQGWAVSLKYKLGNYRSKLRHAGCNEVSVNRKRGREEDGDRSCPSLKKPKRGEVNYVPDHPENHDDDTLEGERSGMVNEMKKRSKDMTFIRQKMDLTFSLRRKEIVDQQPMVSEIQERWPALFSQEQFYRVTTKELSGTFRSASDEYSTRLLKLYRAKTGAIGREMEKLLDKLDHQTSDIGVHRRNTSLQGLPLFLREDSEKLFRKCLLSLNLAPPSCFYQETDPDDNQTRGLKIGILTVLEDDGHCPHRSPRPPHCVCLAVWPALCLNINFPKENRYTFEVIETIFMKLSTNCTQRVRSLKTKLLLGVSKEAGDGGLCSGWISGGPGRSSLCLGFSVSVASELLRQAWKLSGWYGSPLWQSDCHSWSSSSSDDDDHHGDEGGVGTRSACVKQGAVTVEEVQRAA